MATNADFNLELTSLSLPDTHTHKDWPTRRALVSEIGASVQNHPHKPHVIWGANNRETARWRGRGRQMSSQLVEWVWDRRERNSAEHHDCWSLRTLMHSVFYVIRQRADWSAVNMAKHSRRQVSLTALPPGGQWSLFFLPLWDNKRLKEQQPWFVLDVILYVQGGRYITAKRR